MMDEIGFKKVYRKAFIIDILRTCMSVLTGYVLPFKNIVVTLLMTGGMLVTLMLSDKSTKAYYFEAGKQHFQTKKE